MPHPWAARRRRGGMPVVGPVVAAPDVAEALGASGARLIGGQVVGSLCFERGEHEWGFLSEAGDSFCFL